MRVVVAPVVLFLVLCTSARESAHECTPHHTSRPQHLGRAWCSPPPSSSSSSPTTTTTQSAAPPSKDLISLLTNVKGAIDKVYDLKDSTGQQMASLHVLESTWEARYVGLYMAMLNNTWEVRVATSQDLIEWTFHRTLLPNADMPYVKTIEGSDWVLMAHEQWMNAHSKLPSRLGFKLFSSVGHLLNGTHFDSFVAPLTVGNYTQLEGTPSIYTASIEQRNGLTLVDVTVGFHYNDHAGVDQVAQGSLTSFGSPNTPPRWEAKASTSYNEAFIKKGAIGNIGQRASGSIGKATLHSVGQIIVQEANIGHMPPTIWQDWRLWLYLPAPGESYPPTGQGTPFMLTPETDKGSTAFGNPSFQSVPCPFDSPPAKNSACLFVSFFAFGEGAKPGEAGVVAFYNRYYLRSGSVVAA